MADPAKPLPTWKRALALVLDFVTAFYVFGILIAQMTGETTDGGFKLQGTSSLLLAVLVAAYFYIARRYAGGTLWEWIFRIGR